MNIDLAAADYALLHAVVVQEWQVYLLSGGMDMETVMNTPSHGLAESDLIERFFDLWRHGLVECSHDEAGPPAAPAIDLLRRQFAYASDHPPEEDILIYRLSAAGGALWEELSSPDWSKFLRSSGRSEKQWVLGAGDRSRLELLRKCPGWFPPPVIETERSEVRQPWQATYWKTVPTGYEITFEYDYRLEGHRHEDIDQSACHELWETWHQWHRDFKDVCDEYFRDS